MHKRLGEQYEARGDIQKAVEHYNEFVELWKDAGAVLRPQVQNDVRAGIARLVGVATPRNSAYVFLGFFRRGKPELL